VSRPAAREAQFHDGHAVLGERAGLVREDDGRRPQGLDGGELLDERIPPGHPPHPSGQGDGRNNRKPFRNRGDRQRNGDLDREEHLATRGNHDPGYDDADRKGETHQAPCEAIETLFERRGLGLGLVDQRRDLAKLRRHPRRYDDGLARPSRDRRSLEEHGAALRQTGTNCNCPRVLVDRKRLARQRGFIHLEE
jgi:hypothetical protein